MAFDLEIIPTV